MKAKEVENDDGSAMSPSGEKRDHRGRPVPPGFQLEPPDGGFVAWSVVAGAALAGMTISIPQVTFSFILSDVLYNLNCSTATAAWIPSIISTVNMFVAPVCSIIVDRYSCRVAVMFGGFISALGMILSSFAPSIEVLFLTLGFCGGFGQGLVINASLIALSQYFRRRYSLVLGIAIAFWAGGRLVFSPLIQFMLDSTIDFRGVLLIAAGISLHACVGGATFQPAKRHLVLVAIKTDDDIPMTLATDHDTENALTDPMLITEDDNEETEYLNLKSDEGDISRMALETFVPTPNECTKMALISTEGEKKMSTSNETKMASDARKNSIPIREDVTTSVRCVFLRNKLNNYRNSLCRILDFKLFVEPLFYILLSSRLIGHMSSVYPVIFLPPYMISKGLEPMEAATIASIMAGAEIVGRVINPWMQNYFKLNVIYFFIVTSALQGIAIIGLVFVESFMAISVLVTLCGIFHGGCVAFSLVVMVDCFGADKLSSVLALTKPLQGVVSMGVGPIIGHIRDKTGNYDACYSVMGALRFLVSIIWCLKPLAMRRKKNDEQHIIAVNNLAH